MDGWIKALCIQRTDLENIFFLKIVYLCILLLYYFLMVKISLTIHFLKKSMDYVAKHLKMCVQCVCSDQNQERSALSIGKSISAVGRAQSFITALIFRSKIPSVSIVCTCCLIE